ncbi:MAG: hypothetical protein V9F00_06170, partial [Nocardioides sp.]
MPDESSLSALQTTVAALQAQVQELQSKTATLQSTADALQSKTDKLQTRVDALEAQLGDPECPTGYTSIAKPFVPMNLYSVLCKNGDDEIVRIGSGGAAFWIDR